MLGGEKGVLKWWMVKKKPPCWVKICFISFTLVFGSRFDLFVGVISILQLPILLSFQYQLTSSLSPKNWFFGRIALELAVW